MVGTTARPTTVEELSETVRDTERVRTLAAPMREKYRMPSPSGNTEVTSLDLSGLTGIVEFSPNDQVVVVRSGTPFDELQAELGKFGHCLPTVDWLDGYSPVNVGRECLANEVGLNLPHTLEAECGSWRDWILGATVVRANGAVAKCGSKAVKNVAGYDFHRFLVGARGTLAVPFEFIFRTFPVRSLPTPRVIRSRGEMPVNPRTWVQRTLASDFETAAQHSGHFGGIDIPGTSTLYRWLPDETEMERFPGDWVLRSGCGPLNLQISDPAAIRLMTAAKTNFDPTGKLNPGEMGIF